MNIIVLGATNTLNINLESMRKLHLYAVEFEDSQGNYNIIKNKITEEVGMHSLEALVGIIAKATTY